MTKIDSPDPSAAGNSPLAELDKQNLREAMRAEAQQIADSHPLLRSDVTDFWDGQQVAPITPPAAGPVKFALDGPISPGQLASVDISIQALDRASLTSRMWHDQAGPYCTVTIGDRVTLYLNPAEMERLRDFLGEVAAVLLDMQVSA
jgi:hypothetical protein